MVDSLKLLLVVGARPNFMKVAPLIHAIQRHNASILPLRAGERDGVRCSNDSQPSTLPSQLSFSLVHTGQHYDAKMSDVFFRELGIPAPDINLEVGSGSHAAQTAQVMLKFEPVLLAEKPDWVVVVGDVNSTVACTLVASKLGIKVAHVEAGLRSFDRTMPEEINRLVTDAIADLLLTPSEDANENLRREGVPEGKIKLVGNIMIDALIENLPASRQSRILDTVGVKAGQFVYVTLHRPANVDHRESLCAIMAELQHLAARLPVVFPMHPRTRKMLADFGITVPSPNPQPSAINSQPTLRIIEPIGYHDSLCLTENARLVLTDSGGLQEESTYFRTPCLTLRPNTERPVTLTHGSNRLTKPERLAEDIAFTLNLSKGASSVPPLWDGKTSPRILHWLLGGTGNAG